MQLVAEKNFGGAVMDGLFTAENTVLGIGNIILSDEGFGVRVVEFLEKNFTLAGKRMDYRNAWI